SADLTDVEKILNLVCYAGASADTTACTVDGYTTSTDYYINIYAANGGTQSLSPNRHAGVWDTSKYYLSSYQCLIIKDTNVSISGLQIEMASTGLYAYGIYSNIALSNGITRNCIVKDNQTGTSRTCYKCTGGQIYENCIAINGAYVGFNSSSGDNNVLRVYIYNCTAFGCSSGIVTNTGGTRVRNCAVFNNADDFNGTFESIQYCASDDKDGTNAVDISPGATEADDWNAAFTDYANGDFSVKDTSSPLYDAGTDLSAYFTTDIIGTTRSTWDIGAFEYVAP
ncbi:MAG TPA: choice-of-anchor Q domain-containing protein, partial [Deltaproteobacteria bacterium]|nr:choice-of-anchor Q domain-containing protein [Deltaproteobacteria bacterium]